MKLHKWLFAGVLVLSSVCSTPVFAEQGDYLIRIGGHSVNPKSDNHAIVEVQEGHMLTFNVSYFVTPRVAVEVLAALPFEHDVELVTGGTVASVKHLPPTISLQYHFSPDARFRPYVGVGLNVTEFFEEDTRGALAGADLELDRSYGAAAQVGLDMDVTDRWFLNTEIRYMDIDTDAKLNGASLGTIEIDPWSVGLSFGFRM